MVILRFKYSFIIGSLGCFALALENLLFPYSAKLIIDSIGSYTSGISIFDHMQYALMFLVISWLVTDIIWRIAGFSVANFVSSAESYVKEIYNVSFLMQKSSFFRKHKSGDLFGRVVHTASELPYLVEEMFYTILPCIANSIGAIYIASRANGNIAILIGTWLTLHLGISVYFFKKEIRFAGKYTRSVNQFHNIIKDTMDNNSNIRLFDGLKSEKRIFRSFSIRQKRDNKKMRYMDQFMLLTVGFLAFLFNGVGLTYLLITNYVNNTLTIGDIAMMFYLVKDLTGVVFDFNVRFGEVVQLYGMMGENYKFIKDVEYDDLKYEKQFSSKNGEIVIKGLDYAHSVKTVVFKDFNLHIKKGEKVGIVGHSGCGKSTLVGLLIKEYTQYNGSIMIDGEDISGHTQKDIMKHISYVPQNPALFNRSILDNIRYSNKTATMKQIVDICKRIGIHEQIMSMPEQYDEKVGEGGSKLSGGQRQRIAIARAMLVNSSIFIFDEATSALDIIAELEIKEIIDKIAKDKTVITIAHRLSTIMSMDRVLVFNNGKIVEDGSHSELAKQKDSEYSKIIKLNQSVIV